MLPKVYLPHTDCGAQDPVLRRVPPSQPWIPTPKLSILSGHSEWAAVSTLASSWAYQDTPWAPVLSWSEYWGEFKYAAILLLFCHWDLIAYQKWPTEKLFEKNDQIDNVIRNNKI